MEAESSGELTAHLTSGAFAVYAIEALKASGWCTWLTVDSKTLNRMVSAVAAAIAVVGIGWNYDATVGTLVITGLTKGAVVAACWEWAKQFVLQQVLYDSVIQKAGKTTIELPSSLPKI